MFQLTQSGRITHITFRHQKGNPIDVPFVQSFFDALNSLPEHSRVVIIEGSPHFSVGMNLKTLNQMKMTEVETLFSIYEQLLIKLETAPFISIAKITGYAMGAGAELALACDFRVMEQKAKIGFPGVTVGFAYNTKRLPRLVSLQTARRLILTGSTLPAEEAFSLGITDYICGKQQIDTTLHDLASSFLDKSPAALQYAKAALLDMDPDRAVRHSIQSGHYKEGTAAFLEQRPPQWDNSH